MPDEPTRKAHTFDRLSGFCTRCGKRRSQVGAEECAAGENVFGISHKIAAKERERTYGLSADIIPC